MFTRTRQTVWTIAGLLVFLIGLTSLWGNANAGNVESEPAEPSSYILDLTNRTAAQTISQELTAPQQKKFVQVSVTDISNPNQIPISFRVQYQGLNGEKSSLGTFSLFPPNNPGTFIVATRGKLQNGGIVSVSLEPIENVNENENISVQVGCISFIEG